MSELEISNKISDEQHQIIKTGGKKGLVNLFNTCYMNSAIQALLHIVPLSVWFKEKRYEEHLDESKNESYIVKAWDKLVKDYYTENNERAIRPTSFHRIIKWLADEKDLNLYALGNQNDTHEFLNFFMDALHEALSFSVTVTIKGQIHTKIDRITVEAYKKWSEHYYNDYSPIVGFFYGQFISVVTCHNCNNDSRNFSSECCFALPIPSSGHKGKAIDIYDCWNTFTEPEDLIDDGKNDNRYRCEKCDSRQNACKRMSIWKFPKVMIILLKRFKNNGHHSAKIDTMVNYPFDLDLSDYCGSYEKSKSQYKLTAVCNHVGGTSGGHYYAFCHDSDDKWRKYNDSTVTVMNPKDVIAQSAYCLFYKQV